MDNDDIMHLTTRRHGQATEEVSWAQESQYTLKKC